MGKPNMHGKAAWLLAICLLALLGGVGAKPLAESIDYSLYDDPAGLNYSIVRLPPVNDEGYTEYRDENVSLKWKADIYLPEDGPVFGLQPLNPTAIIRLHIKDIQGFFKLNASTDWAGLDQFPREKEWHVGTAGVLEKSYFISGVSEVTTYRKHGIISFLGNILASPPLFVDRIDNAMLTNYTVFVPKNRKILGIYRGPRTFDLDEHTYFFVKTNHLIGIMYVNEPMKLAVHIGLSLIVLLLVAIILKFYEYIPSFSFRAKDLLFIVLLCWLLMMQLTFVTPNPNSAVYYIEGGAIKYGGNSIQHYLRLITGLTNSVDVLVVNDGDWCWPGVFQNERNLYLITQSVQNVYMDQTLFNSGNACIEESKPFFGSKLVVLPDDEASLRAALAKHKHQYPWKAAWGISRRAIYLLFLLISFLSTALIVLWAFEVRTLRDWLAFGTIAFFYAYIVQFLNLATGFVARMPVTYHGTSSLPLTMSAKVLPFFNQAHNIRMVLLLLGVLFVFVFATSVRKKVSVRVFLLPVLILGFMLAMPQTEYSTKAFIVAFACGGCGFEYKGPLDTFNAVKMYAAMRGDTALEVLVNVDDVDAYNRAKLLQDQGNREGAIDLYEEYIVTYPNSSHYLEALQALAGLNFGLGRYYDAERYLQAAQENELGDYTRVQLAFLLRTIYVQTDRREETAAMMQAEADKIKGGPWKAQILVRLGLDYFEDGRYAEAKRALQEALSIVDIREEEAANARRALNKIAEEAHA